MALYLFFSHEKANLCMLNPHRKKRGWAKTTERQQELFKLLHHLAHYYYHSNNKYSLLLEKIQF